LLTPNVYVCTPSSSLKYYNVAKATKNHMLGNAWHLAHSHAHTTENGTLLAHGTQSCQHTGTAGTHTHTHDDKREARGGGCPDMTLGPTGGLPEQ
jgi:hypothetical protein